MHIAEECRFKIALRQRETRCFMSTYLIGSCVLEYRGRRAHFFAQLENSIESKEHECRGPLVRDKKLAQQLEQINRKREIRLKNTIISSTARQSRSYRFTSGTLSGSGRPC